MADPYGYASAGNSIAQGISGILPLMQQYHQEHKAYDDQMAMANALGRIGIGEGGQVTVYDPASKDKTVKPLVDQKVLEGFQTSNHAQQMKATGALEAINRIGMSLAGHQVTQAIENQSPRGRLTQKALDTPFFTMPDPVTGQPVMGRNTPSGAVLGTTGGQTPYQQAVQNRFQINRAITLRKELAKGINESGFSPEDFLSPKVVGGVQDKSGKYIPVDSTTGVQPQVYGIPDEKGQPQWFPAAEFAKYKQKAAQYQQLGQVAFSGLSGGKQNAPVLVKTPAEAAALPPGTLVQTPDGRIGRTKGAAPETESATEDSGETGEE